MTQQCFSPDPSKSKITDCESITRIMTALKHVQLVYDEIGDESDRNVALEAYFADEYTELLDDYNHIISSHSGHLEHIHQQLSKCCISKCKMAERYNRRRFDHNRVKNKAKNGNHKLYHYLQLIDTIHFWLFHQFDANGLRIKRNFVEQKIDHDTLEINSHWCR